MLPTRRFGNQRGTSTLEFIVVLPTLLFLLFGIIEVSRAFFTLNLATTAAREMARAAAVAPAASFPDPPSAMQRMNDILPSGWSPTGGVTCSVNPCASDAQVVATVTLNFQTVVPLLQPALGSSMVITQTARARYE
jgi:Flp pilus assembly protein TadG